MATKKSKSSKTKKSSAAVKTPVVKAVERKSEVAEKVVTKKSGFWQDFFARKFDASENILTIFKTPKIYGAMLAELFGVMILTIFLLSFSVIESVGLNMSYQLNLQIMFVILGLTAATYAISGANLNPIITIGLMATRRMSAIRGVLYMLVQVVGAWLGFMIIKGFYSAGGEAAAEAVQMPAVAEIADGQWWVFAVLGLISAVIIGFFFARALAYKKSVFTFASIVAAGVLTALLVTFAIQTSFFELPATYNLAANMFTVNNPAVAFMYQILPSEGANFGALLGDLGLALAMFVGIPAVGGVFGFYLSDAMTLTAGNKEELKA
jgi:glycerol uptake facilitator-like aquaporin